LDDPWLQSFDLEYHNIDPLRGLFLCLSPGKANCEMEQQFRLPCDSCSAGNTVRQVVLAQCLFFRIVFALVINWDSIACYNRDFLVNGFPFPDLQGGSGTVLSQSRAQPNRLSILLAIKSTPRALEVQFVGCIGRIARTILSFSPMHAKYRNCPGRSCASAAACSRRARFVLGLLRFDI